MKNNWTKSSEKLPTKDGLYLVWSTAGVHVSRWSSDMNSWQEHGSRVSINWYTYWMLLPVGPTN